MSEVIPKFVGLSKVRVGDGQKEYDFLISDNETVLLEYKSIRDRLVVTNKKLLTIDVQGLTGRKKEYMTIWLSSVTAFSCETAGTFDLDSELKVWSSGVGKLEYQFIKGTDIRELTKVLNESCGR